VGGGGDVQEIRESVNEYESRRDRVRVGSESGGVLESANANASDRASDRASDHEHPGHQHHDHEMVLHENASVHPARRLSHDIAAEEL
jgi:hypothetical protein